MATNDLYTDRLFNLIIKADEGDMNDINNIHNYYSLEDYSLYDYPTDFIKMLNERADQDNPYSLLHLSIMYLLGLGLEKDFTKGIDLLVKSMNLGCSQAYYTMAMLVVTDQVEYTIEYDELLNIAIGMNNSSALVQKGIEYSDIDFKKSSDNYKKAIEFGNDYAIYKLGELYHDNHKYKLAIKYYNQAMNKNVDHAYFNLAVMYREGEGVSVDLTKSKELFKKAMSLGNIKALTCIGSLYEQLDDLDKAKKYYKLGASKDDTFAKYNLALLYKTNNKHKKTIKYLIESAKDGHRQSYNLLVYDYNVTNLNMSDKEIDELLNFHNTFKNFGAYDGFMSR